jgi:putative ABC transport system ATP-binding protein
MAQGGNLLPHLTLVDNLRLVRRIGGADSSGIADLLDVLGVADRANAWPHELSGGELVRGSIAVALVNRPGVLLADEPTGELDEATEARIIALLRGRADAGCAVLVASHSPAVRNAADRVLLLEDGRLAG